MPRPLSLLMAAFAALAAALVTVPAHAEVEAHFHSFNGSIFFGRYPHAFVVFEGKLDDTGETVDENWGFSAKRSSMAALSGNAVEHTLLIEEPKTIRKTNRHFTLVLTDEQFRTIRREIIAWRDHPGKYYNLDTRNCIHFVGRLAELAGLRVDYPEELLKKPKAWLNRVSQLNPRLDVGPVD